MKISVMSPCLGTNCGGKELLARSEAETLRVLAHLAGRFFRMPVAYVAMLGTQERVLSRVGSGTEYGKYLKLLPLAELLAKPLILRDTPSGLGQIAETSGIKFFASAPLRTPCGISLGALVVADVSTHPEFAEAELQILEELAGIVSASVDARMVADAGLEARLMHAEAEQRFRKLADRAPEMTACFHPNEGCEFANSAWLEFTGWPRAEEPCREWLQLAAESRREQVCEAWFQAFQTHERFEVDAPFLRRDGTYRRLRGSGEPRFLSDGSFAGFTVSLVDATAPPTPLTLNPEEI